METIQKDFKLEKQGTNGLNNIAKNWINGEWVDSEKHSMSFNPATGESIGMYADGGIKVLIG